MKSKEIKIKTRALKAACVCVALPYLSAGLIGSANFLSLPLPYEIANLTYLVGKISPYVGMVIVAVLLFEAIDNADIF